MTVVDEDDDDDDDDDDNDDDDDEVSNSTESHPLIPVSNSQMRRSFKHRTKR